MNNNASWSASDLERPGDYLRGLLQREANNYSAPPPTQYYPTQFATALTSIGPWRKRIASWMYDVVNHFQYNREVVTVALRYLDQYVGHLLVEGANPVRPSVDPDATDSCDEPTVGSDRFQLVAITCLYLAIKLHGKPAEVMLVHEIDGGSFLKGRDVAEGSETIKEEGGDGNTPKRDGCDNDKENDNNLRAVSRKLSDLKHRLLKRQWGRQRLGQFRLPLGASCSTAQGYHSCLPPAPKLSLQGVPYKPHKSGMLAGPLRLHSFVELGRNRFNSADIEDMERRILAALNYVVNLPTGHRYVDELLRVIALTYRNVANCEGPNVEAVAAGRIPEREQQEILRRVMELACTQVERAASVPQLGIGCLPSVLAYAAVLNGVEGEFAWIGGSGKSSKHGSRVQITGSRNGSTPQLEDPQQEYPLSSAMGLRDPKIDKELFLEAWKEHFLATVLQATDGFLCPDSQDVVKVRQLLAGIGDQVDKVLGTNKDRSPLPRSTMGFPRTARPPRARTRPDAMRPRGLHPTLSRDTAFLPQAPLSLVSSQSQSEFLNITVS